MSDSFTSMGLALQQETQCIQRHDACLIYSNGYIYIYLNKYVCVCIQVPNCVVGCNLCMECFSLGTMTRQRYVDVSLKAFSVNETSHDLRLLKTMFIYIYIYNLYIKSFSLYIYTVYIYTQMTKTQTKLVAFYALYINTLYIYIYRKIIMIQMSENIKKAQGMLQSTRGAVAVTTYHYHCHLPVPSLSGSTRSNYSES